MKNKMLLCGNGFSMNFDSGFGNIMDRLYEAHLDLKRYGEFNIISSNREFKDKGIENYKAVLDYLRSYSKDKLYNIFNSALEFGKVLVEHDEIFENLKLQGKIQELNIKVSEWSILKLLVKEWETKDLKGINIEYITILVYFYYQLSEEELKSLDVYYNSFIKLLRIGGRNDYCIGEDSSAALGHVLYNGFTTYYRLLFSIAIFNNGKAMSLENLDKISDIDLNGVIKWLNEFESIFTLNYDNLLELIVPQRNIIHLHGSFELNNIMQICNYQSLRMKYNNTYVDFSDILIGDYIYNKTNREVANCLTSNDKVFNNKVIKYSSNYIESEINNNKINEVLIFGLNINNDQHIIRSILVALYTAQIEKPIIKYCYFSEQDKIEFNEIYKECLNFGYKVLEYIDKNIRIDFINTKDILNKYFIG